MTIGTNAAVQFWGTQDTLEASGASISAGAIAQADNADWTNDDDAPYAVIDLVVTYGTAPTENALVSVYYRRLNIDGTNDANAPTATYRHEHAISFPVENVGATAQYFQGIIPLPNGKTSAEYQFWVYNGDGTQTISAGWTLKITPTTMGPHA